MFVSAIVAKIARPAVLAMLCICCAAPAWAGGGGEDAGSLQSILDGLCAFFNIGVTNPTTGGTVCPARYQYPTAAGSPITELVLQIAAFENSPPEMVRYINNISPTSALNALNPPAGSRTDPAQIVLSNLTPLAFVSPPTARSGAAVVTQLGDTAANSFFYAGTNGVLNIQPDTLFLFYDYPARTTTTYAKGQDIADVSVPLVVVNGDFTQRSVPTVLQVRGAASPCAGGPPCYTTSAVGDFLGSGKAQTVPASDLGISAQLSFGSSPNAKAAHAIFSIAIKLAVTNELDPEYFLSPNPISPALPTAFMTDLIGCGPTTGCPAKDLPAGALGIGVAPGAMLGPPTVPGGPPTPPFTAAIANNFNGLLGIPPAAASAYLAIATDGETLVSTPVSP